MLSRLFGEDSTQGDGQHGPQRHPQQSSPAGPPGGRGGGLQRSSESIESAQDWRNEELQDMQMKLESAMERLNRESTLADQLRAALSNKEGEAEQLQQTVKMLQAENSRLNNSSTDGDGGSVKKLKNRIEEQEAKITALQSALQEAHAAKKASVSSVQQQEEYQGLREELGRLQESVERYQAELQRREVENRELQGELADAKRADDEQRSDLSSRVESAEKIVSELREELQRAHEDEAATVGKYEARIEELERANSPKRGDVSSMASSYEVVDLDPNTMEHPGDTQLEEAARMAEEDKAALRAELAERTAKVDELQNSVHDLQEHVEDLTARLREAEAGRERSLQELSEATLTLKDQQKGAEEGRARADEEAESLRRELEAKELTYNNLLRQVEEMREHMEEQAKELVAMATEKAAASIKSEEEVAHLKEQLQQAIGRSNLADGLEEELSDAQMALTEAQDRESALEEAAEKAKNELAQASSELNELREEVTTLQETLAASRREVMEYKESLESLQADADKLKEELSEAEEQREAERLRADRSEHEVEETKRQLAELKAGEASKDGEMDELRARLEEMHEEFGKAQDDLCSAESMIEEYDQENRAKSEHIMKLTEALEARDDFINQVTDYRDLLVKDVAVLGEEAENRATLAAEYYKEMKTLHKQLSEAHEKGSALARAWQQSGADRLAEVKNVASKAAASLKEKDELIAEIKGQYHKLADKYTQLAEKRQREIDDGKARLERASEANEEKLSSVIGRAQAVLKSVEDDNAAATSRTEAYINSIMSLNDRLMATLKSSSKQSEGEMAKIVTMLQTERRKRRSAEEALEKVSSESAGQEPSAAASRRLAVHLARHVQDLTATIKELREKQGEEKPSTASIESSGENSDESLESLQRESSRLRRAMPDYRSSDLSKCMVSLSSLKADITTTEDEYAEDIVDDLDEDFSPSHIIDPLPSTPTADDVDSLAGLVSDETSVAPVDCSAAIEYFQDWMETSIPESPRFKDVDLEHTVKADVPNQEDLPSIPTLALVRPDILRSETDGWSTQVAPSVIGGHPESTIGEVPPPNRVDEASSDRWDNFAANAGDGSQVPPSSSSASSCHGDAWSTERQGSIATTTEVAAASSQPEATRDMEGVDGGTGGARQEHALAIASTGSEGVDFIGSSLSGGESELEPERLQEESLSERTRDSHPEATQSDTDVGHTPTEDVRHQSRDTDDWLIGEETTAATRQPESTVDVSPGSSRLQQDEEDGVASPEEGRPGGAADLWAREAPSKTPEIVAAVPEEEMVDVEDMPEDGVASHGVEDLQPRASSVATPTGHASMSGVPVGSTIASPGHDEVVLAGGVPADDDHAALVADDGHDDVDIDGDGRGGVNVDNDNTVFVASAGHDDVVTAPGSRDDVVTAPGSRDDVVTAPGSRDDVVTAPGSHDDVVTAPGSHDGVVTAPDGHDDVVTAPDGRDDVVTAPDGRDDVVTAPGSRDDVVTAPGSHDDVVTALGSHDDVVTAADGHDAAVAAVELHQDSPVEGDTVGSELVDEDRAHLHEERTAASPASDIESNIPANYSIATLDEDPVVTQSSLGCSPTPWDSPKHEQTAALMSKGSLDLEGGNGGADQGGATPWDDSRDGADVDDFWGAWEDAEPHANQQEQRAGVVSVPQEKVVESHDTVIAPDEEQAPLNEGSVAPSPQGSAKPVPLSEHQELGSPVGVAEPSNLWDDTEVDSLAMDGWDDHVQSPAHIGPFAATSGTAVQSASDSLWDHPANASVESGIVSPDAGWGLDQDSPRVVSSAVTGEQQVPQHLPTTPTQPATHVPVSGREQETDVKKTPSKEPLDDDFWDLLNSA